MIGALYKFSPLKVPNPNRKLHNVKYTMSCISLTLKSICHSSLCCIRATRWANGHCIDTVDQLQTTVQSFQICNYSIVSIFTIKDQRANVILSCPILTGRVAATVNGVHDLCRIHYTPDAILNALPISFHDVWWIIANGVGDLNVGLCDIIRYSTWILTITCCTSWRNNGMPCRLAMILEYTISSAQDMAMHWLGYNLYMHMW